MSINSLTWASHADSRSQGFVIRSERLREYTIKSPQVQIKNDG